MTRIIMLVTASALLLSGAAEAQQCHARDEIAKQLKEKYQEAPKGLGLMTNGNILELWTSAGGGFTLLVVKPSGVACIIGAGTAWKPIPHFGEEGPLA